MKRVRDLYHKIADIENLKLAARKAKKGKSNRPEVIYFFKHEDELLIKLQKQLLDHTYITSEYTTFKIYEPKERVIYKLPFYPDRIVHHAVMNILESIWTSIFIGNTYSCIKGKGIHGAFKDVKKALKDRENTTYCLKLDIRKFYPSIDHDNLKYIIRKKIKDKDLLILLDEIIDSTDGVPIGNYLSQFFANLFISYLDHDLKEKLHVKYYFRYADDIIILANSKQYLHEIRQYISNRLQELKLQLKNNYQVFDVESRGISFVGYVFYHGKILLRKRIKVNLCKRSARLNKHKDTTPRKYRIDLCSYTGLAKFCNARNLIHSIDTKQYLTNAIT